MEHKDKRSQIGLRLPQELNQRLEEHVQKIGISKSAFILTLIFNALEDNNKKDTRAGDD